ICVKGFTEMMTGTSGADALLQASVAATLTVVALGVGVFHLGRPWLAWRAVLNLRTSWFSREALACGLFAKLVLLYAVLSAAPALGEHVPFVAAVLEPLVPLAPVLQKLAAGAGILAVFCSVMVYVATKRPHWSGVRTGVKFFGSALLLGTVTVLTVSSFASVANAHDLRVFDTLLEILVFTTLLKLGYEASLLL